MFSKEELIRLYLKKKLSQSQIAELKKVTKTTVRNYMKRYGIQARKQELKDRDYLNLHERWRSIQRRCKRDEVFFCSEWRNYEAFKKWCIEQGWDEIKTKKIRHS